MAVNADMQIIMKRYEFFTTALFGSSKTLRLRIKLQDIKKLAGHH
jgi:hypothetical protein